MPKKRPHPDDLITMHECADILGVGRDQAYNLIVRQGRCPAIKFGQTWVAKRGDVVELAKIERPTGRPPSDLT